MAKPSALKARIEVEGLTGTLAAFKAYGRDAQRELRAAAGDEVTRILPAITAAGSARGGQAALAAPSVRRISDRVPAIAAGGARRARPHTRPDRRVSAGDLFFGSEFGGGGRPSTRQFPTYVGRRGRWFWPTLNAHLPELRRRYLAVLDDLAAKWGGADDG